MKQHPVQRYDEILSVLQALKFPKRSGGRKLGRGRSCFTLGCTLQCRGSKNFPEVLASGKAVNRRMVPANIDQQLGLQLWELLQKEAADLGYEMSSVQVNKNFPGQAHRDRNDTNFQWACSLGDFTGGTLCWTEQSCEESWEFCADTRKAWTMLDGRHLHWVTPHDGGDRYSLVLFQNTLHPPRPIYYCSEAQALNREE